MITARVAVCRRVMRSVTLLVAIALTQTGCQFIGQDSPGEDTVTVDLETSRQQFRAELQAIEQMLEPARFALKGEVEEIPMTCELPGGDEGRSYLFDTREAAEPVEDPEAKANLIADYWRGKGYDVRIATELGFRVTAKPSQGGVLIFIVGEPGMTLGAETPCVPA